MITLHILDLQGSSRAVAFHGETMYVGRSPDNDVQIEDSFVSRRHLKVTERAGRYFVTDLESKNGTYVQTDQIIPGVEVEIGEGLPIVLGMSVVCVGELSPEEIRRLMDAADLRLESTGDESTSIRARPKTLQNNMALIYSISNLLMQSSEIDGVLKEILDHIFDVFTRIDRGAIILIDEQTGEFSKITSRAKKGVAGHTIMYSRAVVNRVVNDGASVIITDTSTGEEADLSDTLKLLDIKSVMCVPLIGKSRVRGVIYVDSTSKPYGFRKEDLSLFTAFGNTIAVAIEKAMLLPAED